MNIQDLLEVISNYPVERDPEWQLHDLVMECSLTSVLFEVELRRQIILLDARGALDPLKSNCVMIVLDGVLETHQWHRVPAEMPIYAATVLDGSVTDGRKGERTLILDGFLETRFGTGVAVNFEIDLPGTQLDYGEASASEVRRTSPRLGSPVLGQIIRIWPLESA